MSEIQHIIELLSTGEEPRAIELIRPKVPQEDMPDFEYLEQEYISGLEGIKRTEWIKRLKVFAQKCGRASSQHFNSKFDRVILFDRNDISNHFCEIIDRKKEERPLLFFVTGEIEDLPSDTIERLKFDFRKTRNSSEFWPENPEEDFDAIDLSSNNWKWNLHKQIRDFANVEDEMDITEYSSFIEQRFGGSIFLTLDIWDFTPEHFISFCEELHQMKFTELGKLTVVINFSITEDELAVAKKETLENNLSYVHFYAPEEIKHKDFQRFFKMPRIFDSYNIVKLQPNERITMLEAIERLKAAEKQNPLSL